jgi:threonine aldolase
MRQAGVLAAAGLIALTEMPNLLYKDHLNAQHLAENLSLLPGISVAKETVQTNIVMADLDPTGPTAAQWSDQLKRAGILVNAMGTYRLRFVTHYEVSQADIETTLNTMAHLEF